MILWLANEANRQEKSFKFQEFQVQVDYKNR